MKKHSLRAHLRFISILSHVFFDAPETNRWSRKERLIMHGSVSVILRRARIAAMLLLVLFVVLAFAGTSHAAGFQGGIPWQVGDKIICFGSGTCNALRINGNTVTLLDQFSDGLLGDTRGVAIDNTVHVVVTDNGAGG